LLACAEIQRRWCSISGKRSSRGHFMSIRGWMRPGGSETYRFSHIQRSLFHKSPLDLIVSFLANCNKCGNFFRHITISEGVLHIFGNPILTAFRKADGFQFRLAAITWNPA
jgi:hypothetical protein